MMRALTLAVFATAMPLTSLLAQNGGVRNSRIIGVVADSVDGTPLQGAEVIASGVATTVRPTQFRRFDRGCLTLVVWTQFRGKAAK
jgi:hypothetical protein